MTTPVGKLVMKSSTKVSLNERFTAYREQAESASTAFRDQLINDRERKASVENRRLAQQMANRPSVIAALRLKRRSLQQRLGQRRNAFASGVKSRLNFNLRASPKMQNRLGRGRGRNIAKNFRAGAGNRARRGGFMRSGTSPMIKSRLGPPAANNRKFAPRGFPRKKNFFQNRQNQNAIRNNFKRGIGRRGQAVRGRGRGRGGWNRNAKPVPTRQELDNDLDEYMSETKPTIDTQFTYYNM